MLGGPDRDCPCALGVGVGGAQPRKAERPEAPSRSGALTMPEVLTSAGFRVKKYRNVCGCWALGYGVIVFCLATGEWTIRRLDSSELSSGHGGPDELADALCARPN